VSHHHISEDDLERMCLGTIELDELARLAEHALSCAECAERLEETRDYIHAMQRALKTLAPDRPDSKEPN
jgi:anti-sigma factor RsiW